MSTNTEELYFDVQQKTDKQHILDNPDTYIGSVENVDSDMWIMNDTNDKIIEKNINYIPGLFKLFDEGIVNCRDHVIRMKTKVDQQVENSLPVTYIDVSIQEDGTIYVGTKSNNLCALTPDGRIKWKFKTDGWVYYTHAIADDGTIYFGCYDKHLYAITKDGKLKWKFILGRL